MNEYKNGVPPDPGLYLVKYENYTTVFSVWNGKFWYGLSTDGLGAERYALSENRSRYKESCPIPWKEIHND